MSIYKIIDGVYKGPEVFEGSLDLQDSKVTSLGNLKYIEKSLFLEDSKVRDLGNLKYVGGSLYLPDGTLVKDFESYKEEAEAFLKEIKPLDYPLHMNHENWIVRSKINKFLETGEI
jgi:hypothetical protein